MNKKARIAHYLSQGLSPTQTAAIVGVTPAYISQLLKEAKDAPSESEFALLVQEAKEQTPPTEDVVLTNKYAALEHTLISKMETALAYAELPAITRALEVVASRQEKRASRMAAPASSNTVVQNIVNLTIPSHAVPEYTINAQKEVVQIGSQQLAPLSSEGVKALFSAIAERKGLEAPATILEIQD